MNDQEQPDYYEAEDDQAEMLAERLQVFGSRLSKLATEQSGKRQEVENRWLEDIRQYHGIYDARTLSKLQESGGSEIFVNITRNKTNAAEARLQDMLFPTDDQNWAIKPTPVPELEAIKPGQQGMDPQTGQPIDLGKMADAEMKKAEDKAGRMETEISDQLTEARYQQKSRDLIHDSCQLGTGIVKGPVIIGRTKKRWDIQEDGASMLNVEESLEPSVERVDPWDFFPDMSARCIEEAEFTFERRRLSKKQMREFAKLPDVLVEHVREVLKEGAKNTHVARNHIDELREITGVSSVGDGNLFELWEYHGPISKVELMDALGDIDEERQEDIDALDDEIQGVVFFSGDHVIRVQLNPMDTQESVYSVFNWEKDESNIFGFGVPYLMRSPQRVINSSFRMMLDNAGLSVADQVVINRELVSPADNVWQLTPKKLWFLKDKTRSVNEVFGTFSTPSHQQELANVFTMARQLADEETNLPLIAQGEQSSNVTKTSSGMAMLMNSANIVLRRAVKNWDDDITRPLITRFYDWNMQFSESADIKGDFNIDARGSGALLVREKQQENLMIYANISGSNPELAMRRDWAGIDREIAKSLEIPYWNITKSDAEIEEIKKQQQEQGMPPEMQMKQAEMQMKGQLSQAEMQMKGQMAQAEAQNNQAKLQLAQQELQMEFQHKQAELAQKREIAIAELAAKAQMTEQQLMARAQIDGAKNQTTREKAAGDLAIKRTTTQLQAQNLANKYDTF